MNRLVPKHDVGQIQIQGNIASRRHIEGGSSANGQAVVGIQQVLEHDGQIADVATIHAKCIELRIIGAIEGRS